MFCSRADPRASTFGFGVPLACLLLSACGAATQAVPTDAGRLDIGRLYPLRAGSVWTYDVDTGQGIPTLGVTRVLRQEGTRSEVSSGGTPIVYEQRPEGLFRQDLGSFVLKAPIRAGARWDMGQGATAEVVDAAKHVSTPAGEFDGCVEVRETGGASGKQVRTVFCPDVGPVEVESSMKMELSGQTARVLARLRGYDFSGALQ